MRLFGLTPVAVLWAGERRAHSQVPGRRVAPRGTPGHAHRVIGTREGHRAPATCLQCVAGLCFLPEAPVLGVHPF